jgi:hypothetical protein
MQGTAQFIYGTGIPKTLERMSYGDSLFSGSGMTLRPKEETINAAMNIAPFAPAVGRLASRAVRATEGMPVGMGIKDVGKSAITREGNPIQSAVVLVGDKIFMGRTHGDALNRAVYEGVVRKEGGKYIYPKGAEVNSDLFMTKDGQIIDRLQASKMFDIGASETAIEKGLMQNNPPKSMTVDSYIEEATALKKQREQSPYPQQSALTIKPPTDDVYEVMDATFNYGKLGGNKTIPIDQLTGGVRMSDPTEARRVKELADKISSPEGYISRIIVDDSGNVLEGQHRLEALRLLGEKNVPVAVIEDLSNKYDISAMENAIQGKFRSDQSNQLIRQAIDTLEEAGSVEKALSDYSMPPMFQQPFQDAIRASQKVTPTPIESPAFTDPFANTIGSSIR